MLEWAHLIRTICMLQYFTSLIYAFENWLCWSVKIIRQRPSRHILISNVILMIFFLNCKPFPPMHMYHLLLIFRSYV